MYLLKLKGNLSGSWFSGGEYSSREEAIEQGRKLTFKRHHYLGYPTFRRFVITEKKEKKQ